MEKQMLTKEDFMNDKYDRYGLQQFYQYKKLTELQKTKIESLKDGQRIKWKYREKSYEGIIICKVIQPLKEKLLKGIYSSYPYDIRIELSNGRSFWTRKIDNIELTLNPKEN